MHMWKLSVDVLGIKSRPTMFKFRQMNLGPVILAQVLA